MGHPSTRPDNRFREIKNPALSLQRTQGQGRGTLWFGFLG